MIGQNIESHEKNQYHWIVTNKDIKILVLFLINRAALWSENHLNYVSKSNSFIPNIYLVRP